MTASRTLQKPPVLRQNGGKTKAAKRRLSILYIKQNELKIKVSEKPCSRRFVAIIESKGLPWKG